MRNNKSVNDNVILAEFPVPFSYRVCFTSHLFAAENTALSDALLYARGPKPSRVVVFLDEGIAQARPRFADEIGAWFDVHAREVELVCPPCMVPGGEPVKNDYRLIMQMVDTLLEYRLCRHSYVMAIGGGAMLDAVGFATSMVHRGLRLIRVPSTTLAQNDAGVGVKNGMNLHGAKNTIGTFHPPFVVLNDARLLESLPFDHWIGGVAEAFKVAMIKDAAFFRELCKDAPLFRARDAAAMDRQIRRCARLHVEHICRNGDPFETGNARPLDFGHWAAHKLESLSHYRIPHGAAVAVGLAIDAGYAARFGWITPADYAALIKGLQDTGFPLWYPEVGHRFGGELQLLDGLADFQEHLGGELCVTFPDGVGCPREENHIDRDAMIESILALRAYAPAEWSA
jgi:3-dehydroquinate synthase